MQEITCLVKNFNSVKKYMKTSMHQTKRAKNVIPKTEVAKIEKLKNRSTEIKLPES